MKSELFNKITDIDNHAILDRYAKAENVLNRSCIALCSVSGGSDSDIVLDIIHNLDEKKKVTYYWIDTGLEYEATKEHLDFLENKYSIKIERIKALKPIPAHLKPFFCKRIICSDTNFETNGIPYCFTQAGIGFKWEDEPLEVLLKKYPKCKTALQWWCSYYYTDDGGIKHISRFSIKQNKYLKEFIMQNPPDFLISNKCCEYAKKLPAKKFIHDNYVDLEITGIRKSEGGVRSVNYKTCFSNSKSKGCDTYRPLFWYKDKDKKVYEKSFDIQHSRCYTEYGMKRTGCVGCPFNKNINEELEIIKKYEPKLYKAAVSIFGKSYEYTRRYREFAKMMKRKEKEKCL